MDLKTLTAECVSSFNETPSLRSFYRNADEATPVEGRKGERRDLRMHLSCNCHRIPQPSPPFGNERIRNRRKEQL